jgi:hypothetical protein
LDARLSELLEQISTAESGPAWGELKSLHLELKGALNSQDSLTTNQALSEMGDIIESGVMHRAAWQEVYDVVERMAKLKRAEHQRLSAMHQMITVERAMAMVARVTKAVIDNVSDPSERMAIVSDLRELTFHRDS